MKLVWMLPILGILALSSFDGGDIDPVPIEARCCHPAVWSEPTFGPGCPAGCSITSGQCTAQRVPSNLSGLTCIPAHEGTCVNEYVGVTFKNVPVYDCVEVYCGAISCCTGRPAFPYQYKCKWQQIGTGTVDYFGTTCDPSTQTPC